MAPLKVSADGRHLVVDDGKDTPLEWLADTDWAMVWGLDREGVDRLLDDRKRKGFTISLFWAVGWRPTDHYGHEPFEIEGGTWDAARPNTEAGPRNDYWDHVDYVIDAAARRGLYVGVFPAWGSSNINENRPPYRFLTTEAKARAYGQWIAERYRDRTNLMWLLGGDFYGFAEITGAMAKAIKAVTPDHLMTYHPFSPRSSSRWFHDAAWLDFNMIQERHSFSGVARLLTEDRAKSPVKPTVQSEPLYEHARFPEGMNVRGDAHAVRIQGYLSICFGSMGHTYGHKHVFAFRLYEPDMLDDPGAQDMVHLRSIMDFIGVHERVPDQSLITSDRGFDDEFTLKCSYRSTDSRRAVAYSADGGAMTMDLSRLAGEAVNARWFDPREGAFADAGTHPAAGPTPFDPPGEPGRDNDWVLVLDAS